MSKLHLGCGPDIKPGWLNIDQIPQEGLPATLYKQWDLRQGLPEVSGVTMIYSSHFWEHMTDAEGLSLMRQCHKILEPGGVFRLAVPSFDTMTAAYHRRDWSFFDVLDWDSFSDPRTRSFIDVCTFGLYQFGEHKSIWDSDKAIKVLNYVGFRNVRSDGLNPEIDATHEARSRYTFYTVGVK